ncbi:hypothetical protein EST35_0425 [Pseudomonas phage vB_PaeM_PA5oct]|uniref:Uncharacterized protein n=1 Tax=Pseudomonas phage vB_PaeM_PA5oct TaxID=2163605 RepID=A0A4Y5JYY6_9CAUD|nr:hypothetical protein PQE65_gp072 [Pseudomonas phage vB_PaeM_PA5oct]QCG76293.1 hypothetical protein EST35_0425 [Pseudomonas phage vB_PaeM_PA5oct]
MNLSLLCKLSRVVRNSTIVVSIEYSNFFISIFNKIYSLIRIDIVSNLATCCLLPTVINLLSFCIEERNENKSKKDNNTKQT